jgi:hypothetical protein
MTTHARSKPAYGISCTDRIKVQCGSFIYVGDYVSVDIQHLKAHKLVEAQYQKAVTAIENLGNVACVRQLLSDTIELGTASGAHHGSGSVFIRRNAQTLHALTLYNRG